MYFACRTFLIRHAEILRFLISGGFAFFANIGVLYLATDVFGVWYLASSVLSFISAFFVSFSMQKFWTFKNRETDRMTSQLGMSLVMAVVNLGLNTGMMYLLVEDGHFHYLIAQVITAGIIAIETYFIYKHIIFVQIKSETLSV